MGTKKRRPSGTQVPANCRRQSSQPPHIYTLVTSRCQEYVANERRETTATLAADRRGLSLHTSYFPSSNQIDRRHRQDQRSSTSSVHACISGAFTARRLSRWRRGGAREPRASPSTEAGQGAPPSSDPGTSLTRILKVPTPATGTECATAHAHRASRCRSASTCPEASKSVGSNGETVLCLKAAQAFGVGVWTFETSMSATLTPLILILPRLHWGGCSTRRSAMVHRLGPDGPNVHIWTS